MTQGSRNASSYSPCLLIVVHSVLISLLPCGVNQHCCPDWALLHLYFYLFQNLGKNLDAVHDITVAYPHNIPQTERHLLLGDFPKEIHFHVHRYPVASLPASKEDLQLWCHKRWEEKEARLRSFYRGEKNFAFTGQTVIPPCKSELRVLVVKWLSILYWTLFSPAMCLLIYFYSLARWYFIIIIVILVLQERLFGGLELIELACYRFLHKQPHLNAKKNE